MLPHCEPDEYRIKFAYKRSSKRLWNILMGLG